jgi:hypothetical protein
MARTIKTPDYLDDHEEISPDGYEQVWAGKPFERPTGVSWGLACCHCGLVHDVRIDTLGHAVELDREVVQLTVRENAAATKRHRKVPGEAPALDEAYRKGYADALKMVQRHGTALAKVIGPTNKKAAP